MPLFFHLKLELYPTPAASAKQHHLHEPNHSITTPFLPPPGSDIFKTSLPAHKTSKWSSYNFPKRPTTPTPTSTSGSESAGSPLLLPPEGVKEGHGETLLLPERTTNRKEAATQVGAGVRPSNERAAGDWRYGRVSVESIDMEIARHGGKGGGQTRAMFIPSDPKQTEVGWGVVHLYREGEEREEKSKGVQENDFDVEACTTLAILAVPSWMMPSDLLGFVGDQAREDVSHFRLIRTGRTNKYMVLMKFRSAKRAREWQKAYNGRLFSAAEPENCHVVFIRSVEFLQPGDDEEEVGDAEEDGARFPQNQGHDPFTPSKPPSRAGKSLSSKPLAPPPPNLLELPTCPVCLERMDETTGLLTILCQHVFHCACLEKWRFPGSGCPVCRYTQSPSYTFPYPRPASNDPEASDPEPLCSVCAAGSEEVNLWICLICGNVGCGRYDAAHAYAHYEHTSHCYAMDIRTQHVWDYAGDGYVHRLIQSKPDFSRGGEKPAPASRHENEAFRPETQDLVPREKMDAMASEYTYLLTSQLEGQRRYFEEQVERAVDKASEAATAAAAATSQAETATADLEALRVRYAEMETSVSGLEKNLSKSERTREKFEKLARDMSAQLREEKTLNSGLMARIRAAEEAVTEAREKEAEVRREKGEMEELNRDLTLFISGQEKVKALQEAGEEVVEGGVGVVEGKKTGGKGKGRKR